MLILKEKFSQRNEEVKNMDRYAKEPNLNVFIQTNENLVRVRT